MTAEQSEAKLRRSLTEGLGWIELARLTEAQGGDASALRKQAVEALSKWSDDDEAVDAMWQADMDEQAKNNNDYDRYPYNDI